MNETINAKLYRCETCEKEFGYDELRKTKYICDSCDYHFRIPSNERISMIVDKGTFEEWELDLETENYLEDENYDETLKRTKEKKRIEGSSYC